MLKVIQANKETFLVQRSPRKDAEAAKDALSICQWIIKKTKISLPGQDHFLNLRIQGVVELENKSSKLR